jgi:tetratricopeptide (TPR) repeat protein
MKFHPHDLLLRQLKQSQRAKSNLVREHVSGCARCRRRLESLRSPTAHVIYDAALSASASRLRDLQSSYAKERAEAGGLLAELLKHPAERRFILVRNHHRFHTWGVLEQLLESSRKESILNPRASEELASLALELSEHLDESRYGVESISDLKGRAWAYLGNARRIGSNLVGAQEALDRSRICLRQGTRDSWELAVWLDLKASLLRAQRDFEEAMRLLHRAQALFLAIGDRHYAGRTLVNMDNVLHHAGRPEEGIPLLYRALELIDPAQDPKLQLITHHNLIDDLAEASRYMEAQRLFIQTRPLYQRLDLPWFRYRRTWVEGKIARGLGQPDRTERLFLAARAGLIEEKLSYDVALVSLDLAGLYAEQGRTAEMKRLAIEMVPIFSSLHVQREALAAFNLWHQAVQAETAGAELAALVAAALRLARYDQPASGQEGL